METQAEEQRNESAAMKTFLQENTSQRKRCRYQFVVLQLLRVDALRVVDGSINLTYAHTLGSKPVQVPHGVKTHITKALQKKHKGLLFIDRI